jgi:hypothetical protein
MRCGKAAGIGAVSPDSTDLLRLAASAMAEAATQHDLGLDAGLTLRAPPLLGGILSMEVTAQRRMSWTESALLRETRRRRWQCSQDGDAGDAAAAEAADASDDMEASVLASARRVLTCWKGRHVLHVHEHTDRTSCIDPAPSACQCNTSLCCMMMSPSNRTVRAAS